MWQLVGLHKTKMLAIDACYSARPIEGESGHSTQTDTAKCSNPLRLTEVRGYHVENGGKHQITCVVPYVKELESDPS